MSGSQPTPDAHPFAKSAMLVEKFQATAPKLSAANPKAVSEVLDFILKFAVDARASDIHLTVDSGEFQILFRIDGVLDRIASYPNEFAPNFIGRLKVLAELLTYRTDVPQEGRLRGDRADVEMRVSTFPTLFGEKAVVRIFARSDRFRWPQDLGLAPDLLPELHSLLGETSGAILITGPAGSGKTTTAYACLREIHRDPNAGKSLVTLEDPIESVLPGVSQSQVNRAAGFDYGTGLRSLMRQDPDVILVGEIRDRETAETVFQASLTGHLVLSTFHAGSAAQAISRLDDMGIEPYLIRAGARAILCQRLFRRLCECATWSSDENAKLGMQMAQVPVPVGCSQCFGTGYQGRMVIAELVRPDLHEIGRAIIERREPDEIQRLAEQLGSPSLVQRASKAVAEGKTTPVEFRRVLGWRTPRSSAEC